MLMLTTIDVPVAVWLVCAHAQLLPECAPLCVDDDYYLSCLYNICMLLKRLTLMKRSFQCSVSVYSTSTAICNRRNCVVLLKLVVAN